MDFMQRGEQRPSQPAAPTPSRSAGSNQSSNGKKSKFNVMKVLRYTSVALLFSVTILLIALSASIVFNDKGNSQDKYVNTKQMQAVFLNGGQVYFGHITNLNSKYMRVSDIYYLRVNQTVQPDQTNGSNQAAASNDVSLVKLGCELHGPVDEMVINQDQVLFWENLKDDGQVAKAVAEFKKQNPNGQQCQQNQDQTSNSSNTTNTGTGTGTTNNTTTTNP